MSFTALIIMAACLLLTPVPQEAEKTTDLDTAIQRGVDTLLSLQNKNGSFGSHHTARNYEVLCTVPGSHRAFTVATSGLALLALDANRPSEPNAAFDEAMAKGIEYMIENARVRRPTSSEFYCSWAYGYGLQSLATLVPKVKDEETRNRMKATARKLIEALGVYQVPDGGWGYLDFEYGTYRPAGSSAPFTTAAIIVGLHKAKQIGIEVPEKMLHKALLSLRRARKADGSYIYGDYLKYMPNYGVNQVKGSISRSPACHIAQYYFQGAEVRVTRADLVQCLENLLKHQRFADIGRKRPIPHEAWYATSGYFFLYGQYYAALVVDALPPEDQARFTPKFVKILLKLQEKDGSWWDYPLYSYHKPYGTAYALLCLSVYRRTGG